MKSFLLRGVAAAVLVGMAAGGVRAQAPAQVKAGEDAKSVLLVPAVSADGKTLTQEIPAAAYRVELAAIAGDAKKGIKPLWVGRTEVRWEAFDVFVYSLDVEAGGTGTQGVKAAAPAAPPAAGAKPAALDAKEAGGAGEKKADAVTRPSKPYLPPDRGFGHDGYAAISMSHHSAVQFCKWMSEKTGRTYRLATEAEWEHAALAGLPGPHGVAGDASNLSKVAWYEVNADSSPHPVGTKEPNAWGLYDMQGNVAEWVDGAGGPVVKGGSYQDGAEVLAVAAKQAPDASWNASDPQSPKSRWWLSDAPFVGFRVVCEMTEAEAGVFAPAPAPAPVKREE